MKVTVPNWRVERGILWIWKWRGDLVWRVAPEFGWGRNWEDKGSKKIEEWESNKIEIGRSGGQTNGNGDGDNNGDYKSNNDKAYVWRAARTWWRPFAFGDWTRGLGVESRLWGPHTLTPAPLLRSESCSSVLYTRDSSCMSKHAKNIPSVLSNHVFH